ncbi:hypothetical protein OV450_6616 [Actinobacteria bacterium OV450]|nr:hypothetical protein OV450_6616 [Actinobacteria bacterium OV450]
MWRRLGRKGEQTLTAALDNPDGDALYRAQLASADERAAQRRAAEREAHRPVCKRCGQKFTDDRWEETTVRGGAWTAGDLTACGTCHADDVAREQAAASTPPRRPSKTTRSWPGPAAASSAAEPDRDARRASPRRAWASHPAHRLAHPGPPSRLRHGHPRASGETPADR